MKLAAPFVLVLAGLAALAGATTAQNAPVPTITSIPPRKSWAPGNLVIFGTNLGLTFTVELDNQPVPILRTTSTRLVAGPLSPRNPGFGQVEVIGGRSVDTGVAEFVPTLTASRRGMRVSVRLLNGEPGTCVLRYAYSEIAPVLDEGIYGPRFLPASANVLFTGVFPDASPLEVTGIRLPIEIGLIGAPLRLQATCFAATSGVTAYTNLAAVPGFGNLNNP